MGAATSEADAVRRKERREKPLQAARSFESCDMV
jgi:hypothetical protein